MSGKGVPPELSALSDAEISRRLREDHGYSCGPIMPTTRNTYLKKLATLIAKEESANKTTTSRASTGRASTGRASTGRASTAKASNATALPVPTKTSPKTAKGRPSVKQSKSITVEEDLSELSDTQLISRLKQYNYSSGPVLPSTRLLLEKKLVKYMTGELPPEPEPVVTKGKRKSSVMPVAKTTKHEVEEENTHSLRERRSLSREIKSAPSNSLLACSDSELEESAASTAPSLDVRRGATLLRKSITGQKGVATRKVTSLPVVNVATKVSPSSTRTRRVSSEQSEGDEDSFRAAGTFITTSTKSRVSPPLSIGRRNVLAARLSNFSDSENEEAKAKTRASASSATGSITERLLRHRAVSRDAKNTLPINPVSGKLKANKIVTQVSPNGLPDGDHDDIQTNWISKSIQIAIVSFFVIIFGSYLFSRYNSGALEPNEQFDMEREFGIKLSDINLPDCDGDKWHSYCAGNLNSLKPALSVIKEIKKQVDEQIHAYYCNVDSKSSLANPFKHDVPTLKSKLERMIKTKVVNQVILPPNISRPSDTTLFTTIFNDALALLEANSKWEIKPISSSNGYASIMIEQKYPKNLDFGCQFKLVALQAFSVGAVAIGVFLIACALYFFVQKRKNEQRQRKELIFDLVQQTLDLLKTRKDAMPVMHTRDTLLNPQERRSAKYLQIWKEVEQFIKANESRVKMCIENVDGEDFRAWKWTGPTENIKTGTIQWQGRALVNRDQSLEDENEHVPKGSTQVVSSSPMGTNMKTFVALTHFLKVRNMVRSSSKYRDSNWKEQIKNAILLKALEQMGEEAIDSTSHGIVHIHVEPSTVSSEGLVYIKCATIEAATNAFHALHGWYCESQLVAVKFLKAERYYQRFPDAQQENTPLQVQN